MKIRPESKTMNARKKCAWCVHQGTAIVVLKSSSKVLRITMNVFEHRYYRLSKILMMLIGQWPYQSIRVRRGILTVLIILIATEIVPQMLAVVKYRNNKAKLLECLILYVFGAISGTKFVSFIIHSQKRLKLINRIRTDWQLWARDREINILHGYTAQGEKLTILYTAVAYTSFFVIMIEPLMPTIVDILMRNGTASREFPYPIVYYSFDEEKYYFYLITYSIVCAWLIITVVISNDVVLITYVQHVCGIFAALGHKLQQIGNNGTSVQRGENQSQLKKKDMLLITSCVDIHNGAIEYANLIEASYTRMFVASTSLGVILINAVGLQVLIGTSDPTTFTRFLCFVLGIMFYYFVECYVSQILADHSISIRFYIYQSQWYKLSPTALKSLQFMTMRCTRPCHLTAGKVVILSVRTFWLTLKTSISFFGCIRSTQGL